MEPKRIIPKIESTDSTTPSTKQPTMNKVAVDEPTDKVFEPEKMKKSIDGKKTSKGLMTLTIILAIIAIAAGAFAYWQYNKAKTDKAALTAAKISAESSLQSTKQELDSVKAKSTANAGYLKIKELGVEIKINSDLENIVYYVVNSSTSPDILFSTKELMSKQSEFYENSASKPGFDKNSFDKNNTADCSPGTNPIGSISKVKTKDQYSVKIDTSYYNYTGTIASCSSDKQITAMAEKQSAALQEAFKSIRKIQ